MFDTTTEQYGTSFIEEKIPLVQKIAGRVHRKLPPSVLKDDLVSAGIIGLLDAANKFDASSGVQFEKYAGFRIRGAMIDELRKMDCVPRAVRAKINRARKFCELFEKLNGRTPEIDELTSLNEAFVYDRDIDLEDCPSKEEDSFEIAEQGRNKERSGEDAKGIISKREDRYFPDVLQGAIDDRDRRRNGLDRLTHLPAP